ncbi:MAG TPA: glycosyltransferase family 4 protein [Desulfitobacterium dehalogenans]|uniref:Glycosyltransferase family 4 protein n=1 Tax=Desulfitobacterium dehalogenans TaxID=36854 RepID=A0A7C7D5J9_9FIRM|nr:glycosyltransferase family 4 protein [Desulfitobacterium dehalogenans]
MKILHIAVHMGGGIGSAYAGLGTGEHQQSILLLEEPVDKSSLAKVRREGFRIFFAADAEESRGELAEADIVVFNWTHHPALTRFLLQFPDIPIRSMLWCHVSGNYFPSLHPEFLKRFEQVIFASPYSLQLPHIQEMGVKYISEHFDVVYGLGDLRQFAQVTREPHDKFVIGYVGTHGFCKLHPKFIDFCAAITIPNVEFAMIGSPVTQKEILFAAEQKGIADRFNFYGQVDNVPQLLSRMDVFGYLLNPQHFGATENALLEAMAAGLPTVALDQCVESVIIRNCKTGLLVKNPQDYGKAIQRLYEDREFSTQMGEAARRDVLRRFSIEQNRKRFLGQCSRIIRRPKKVHRFADFFGNTPADWFLSCVDSDRDCFLEDRAEDSGLIFHELTKGSPRHYHAYFPEDRRLALWEKQLGE